MPSSEINFSPNAKEKGPASTRDQVFQWVIKNGKRIVIFTQAVVLIVFISRFKFDNDVRNITREVEKNQVIVEDLSSIEEQYLDNQRKLGLVKPIIERQIDWKDRLDDFNGKIPNDLTLENFKFSEKSIELSARTKSPQSFQVFISLLSQDQSVQSAVLKSSSYDNETNEFKFIINMETN